MESVVLIADTERPELVTVPEVSKGKIPFLRTRIRTSLLALA